MAITLDTHSLIWFLDKGLRKKLSQKALSRIRQATENEVVYLPSIVMIELMHLVEKGRVKLNFEKVLLDIENSENYKIIPLDTEIIKKTRSVKALDTHDRIIYATALLTNSILISKDKEIREYDVNVVW